MDYTEEQKKQFRQESAVKRHRQVVLAAALVPVVVLLLAGGLRWDERPLFHLPAAVTYAALSAIAGGLVFSLKNWRCPACGRSLGRSIGLCECPSCGIELRSPGFGGTTPPAECTDAGQLKRQFAARERRQGVAFISALSVAAVFLVVRAIHGVLGIPLGLTLALIFAGGVVVLGDRRCPKCGVALR